MYIYLYLYRPNICCISTLGQDPSGESPSEAEQVSTNEEGRTGHSARGVLLIERTQQVNGVNEEELYSREFSESNSFSYAMQIARVHMLVTRPSSSRVRMCATLGEHIGILQPLEVVKEPLTSNVSTPTYVIICVYIYIYIHIFISIFTNVEIHQ